MKCYIMKCIIFITLLCSFSINVRAESRLEIDCTYADGLLSEKDDFFSNFGKLMPGDVVSDSILLKNKDLSSITLFFHTVPTDSLNSEIGAELLEKVQLKIEYLHRSKKDELYYGPLNSKALEKELNLGSYGPKETGQLMFTLTVPSELGNRFSMAETYVKWVFRVEKNPYIPLGLGNSENGNKDDNSTMNTIDSSTEKNTDKPTTGNSSEKDEDDSSLYEPDVKTDDSSMNDVLDDEKESNEKNSSKDIKKGRAPKTGDESSVALYTGILICDLFIFTLCFSFCNKRKTKKKR